jgi:hypothetical protein
VQGNAGRRFGANGVAGYLDLFVQKLDVLDRLKQH